MHFFWGLFNYFHILSAKIIPVLTACTTLITNVVPQNSIYFNMFLDRGFTDTLYGKYYKI